MKFLEFMHRCFLYLASWLLSLVRWLRNVLNAHNLSNSTDNEESKDNED